MSGAVPTFHRDIVHSLVGVGLSNFEEPAESEKQACVFPRVSALGYFRHGLRRICDSLDGVVAISAMHIVTPVTRPKISASPG